MSRGLGDNTPAALRMLKLLRSVSVNGAAGGASLGFAVFAPRVAPLLCLGALLVGPMHACINRGLPLPGARTFRAPRPARVRVPVMVPPQHLQVPARGRRRRATASPHSTLHGLMATTSLSSIVAFRITASARAEKRLSPVRALRGHFEQSQQAVRTRICMWVCVKGRATAYPVTASTSVCQNDGVKITFLVFLV
jgi:hypothetical protein